MAIMIPEKPRQFNPASQEGLLFDALALLSDDYYVFHSVRITAVKHNTFNESEIDFVVFNRFKGVLCLEAKAGHVRFEDGYWLYGNGVPMHNGGPFNQSSANKYKLMNYISESKMSDVLSKCKFFHAVWFPAVSATELTAMTFPPEGDKAIVLTKEALEDPNPFLERIFNMELPREIETKLGEAESRRLVREIFCPQFDVFPSASFDADLKKIVFHRLLKEQAGILDFLDEQLTAAVNGAAGTGKTMIAVEKACRHAACGDQVLFLCFNIRLKEFLEKNYSHENISYYTIAGFACMMCHTPTPNYDALQTKLEDFYIAGSFPYKHVVIDEGQDFGSEFIEEADIIQLLYDIVVDTVPDGTFYVFYDRLQMIQAREMPKFIDGMDCRLTLHRNCRNTENIAITSLRPLIERKPKVFDDAVRGAPAKLYFCNDEKVEKDKVDLILEELASDGYKDIVILTCKTEDESIFCDDIEDDIYKKKYLFTTCRKFKGLEADAVVLTDVDKSTFEEENVLLFYVGASRARLRLEIAAIMTDDDCKEILEYTLHFQGKIQRPKKNLAAALNTVGTLKN